MISKWKNAPCFQLRTVGSGHRFHNGKKPSRANGIEPATSGMQFDRPSASRHLRYGMGPTGERYYSVVPLRPHTPGPGLCRSVFSRPVCPYAIVTFDPVTRDVTILPGSVPASALTGGGGRPRWGGAAPNTPDGWLHVFRVSLQRMDRMGRTDQLVRYSDGRYLTFDPAEVAGCSAAPYGILDSQPNSIASVRVASVRPLLPTTRVCVYYDGMCGWCVAVRQARIAHARAAGAQRRI